MSRHRSKKKHKKKRLEQHGTQAPLPESVRHASEERLTTDGVSEPPGPLTADDPKIKHATAPTVPRKRYGPKDALLDFFIGLIFIALVFSIKLMVEHTTFGKQLELLSYNLLQLQLGSPSPPITIVDISELAPAEFDIGGQTGVATPRESLKEMIEAIAEQSPRVIGIDIDFAPDENGYIHPHDPEFFQFCLDLRKRKGIPCSSGSEANTSQATFRVAGRRNASGSRGQHTGS